MKLSVITINYNNADGLRKTLASVVSQTYRDIEHIIVDGGSTDSSVDVIREYEEQLHLTHSTIHIQWLSEKDNGIYNAMNKGIEIALGYREVDAFNRSKPCGDKNKGVNRSELVEDKCSEAARPERSGVENKGLEIALGRRGFSADHTSYIIHHTSETHSSSPNSLNESQCDYIQILNSGDILAAPDVTERMMTALEAANQTSNISHHTSIPILYGNMLRDYGNGKMSRDVCKAEGNAREVEWTMNDFITGTVNHDPTYIHRSLYQKYGLYDENLKICSDWKWFVNAVVFGGEKLYYMPIDVTIFDTTGISETNLAFREQERHSELEKILPAAILKDYDTWHFPISQVKRLKRYHLWGLVYFMERVLFKLEKWRILQ